MTTKVIFSEQQEGLSNGMKPPELGTFTHQDPYGVPPTETTLDDDQEGKPMEKKPILSEETKAKIAALPPEQRQRAISLGRKIAKKLAKK